MFRRHTRSFETVFALLIFSLFAVCSLFLVLIGANVYRGIVNRMDSNNETRASLSYVANKVHAAGKGKTSVRKIDGRQVLVIESEAGGDEYRTYIYRYGNSVMELFTDAQNPFAPGDGDEITEVSEFQITQTGNVVHLSAAGKDRRTRRLDLCLS